MCKFTAKTFYIINSLCYMLVKKPLISSAILNMLPLLTM
jgi:hypothetical protein